MFRGQLIRGGAILGLGIQFLEQGPLGIRPHQQGLQRRGQGRLGQQRKLKLTDRQIPPDGGSLQAVDQPPQPQQKTEGQAEQGQQHFPGGGTGSGAGGTHLIEEPGLSDSLPTGA